MDEVLGFETPFSINWGSMPQLSGGSWPKWDPGELPDVWPPDLSAGGLPSLNFSEASFPTFTSLGSIPSVTFENGVTDLIQPWTWFAPDWSSIIPKSEEDLEDIDNNPVFQLYVEASENDWKTMLNLGLGDLVAKALEMELEAIIKSEGITYGSKGADYAEWLPRIDDDDLLLLGQIVGVYAGKISLNTEGADQVLVISSKPIVLGNMPDKGKEDLYEKVAFMGQVPVWVRGNVEVGDYILASGDNDGIGMAVSPDHMKIEDIQRIVGKAWSGSNNSKLGLINVAIGLNRNDITNIVLKQQQAMEDLSTRLEDVEVKLNTLLETMNQN
jgi:hypothetical protein